MSTTLGSPDIIAAVAWHVSAGFTEEELAEYLENFLSFTSQQTVKPPLFFLSWSAPDELFDLVANSLEHLFADSDMEGITFYILSHRGQLKQFEHYQKVKESIAENQLAGTNTWMIFGDADDGWAPNRIEFMSSLPVQYPGKTVQLYHCFARHVSEDSSEFLFAEDGQYSSFEYWMCLTRYDVFASFFELAAAVYLRSTYCDLAFDAHLQSQGEQFHFVPTSYDLCEENYMYIKNGDGHMKQFVRESLRMNCVQYLEIKFMRQFPSPLMDPWDSWLNEVDNYGPLQLFTLQAPLNIADLDVVKARVNDSTFFNQTFRPVCCNDTCKSARSAEYKCQTCHITVYCSPSCQSVVGAKSTENHKNLCHRYRRLLSTDIIVDIFSDNFNHHLDDNVQRVEMLFSLP